jgi:hypothetical protein
MSTYAIDKHFQWLDGTISEAKHKIARLARSDGNAKFTYNIVDNVSLAINLIHFRQMITVVEYFKALLLIQQSNECASRPNKTVAKKFSI